MSEPKTDTYDRLKQFMSMTPAQRDEALFLQVGRIKSHLESEGLIKTVDRHDKIISGSDEKPGRPMRVDWLEEKTKKLLKSNANLQKAIYTATGIYLAAKFYFTFLAPINHR